jgi:hypothetical protein
MKIDPQAAFTVVDVDFVSSVAAGHEVVVLELARPGAGFLERSRAACVLDRTSQVVYADHAYWGVLEEANTVGVPAQDPIAALGPGWQVKLRVEGTVVGAVVSTRDDADSNHARTRLHVVPLGSPRAYR